jgi:hypothetical protein
MNSTVLLAEENRQLQGENERQKKKRGKKRAFIATRGILTMQERSNLSQMARRELESRVINQEVTIQPRAPCMCSLYRSLLRTTRTCPIKQVSN